MLSLTLKEGEYLMIGDDIRVQFLEDMSAKCMRIGIEAPKSIPIIRNKLYEEALNEDVEKNKAKLEEIEFHKQIQATVKQKALDRETEKMIRKERKAKERAAREKTKEIEA